MIKIIKELNIEVTKPNVFQAIVAKQYDMNSRFLKVTLTDCGNVVTIPYSKDISVIINAVRPDGESNGFGGEVNEDGTLIVPLHSWMLELDGMVTCDISVIQTTESDNKKLTTTSFDLMVEKAAYGGEDITTDPQYDVLVELIERVENIEAGGGGGGIVDQTYKPESENAQSGIAVNEAIKKNETKTNNTFSNALKGKASGQYITLDDVSPVEHNLSVKVKSKNEADIYGFSANSISNPSSSRVITNNYGTTISTIDPSGSIEVTQTKWGNETDPVHYSNGYFAIGFYNDYQEGEYVQFSFDLEIKENPLNATTMSVMANGASPNTFTFTEGRNVVRIYWRNRDDRQYIEFRNAGCSLVISNIQVERGEPTPYTPFISNLKDTTLMTYGKNLLNYDPTDTSGNVTILEQTENGVIVQGNVGTNPGSNSWSNGWYNVANSGLKVVRGVPYVISCDFTFIEDPYRPESVWGSYWANIGFECVGGGTLTKTDKVFRPEVGVTQRVYQPFIPDCDAVNFVFKTCSGTVKIENFMLAVGTTEGVATEYEPYSKDSAEYTPNEDGTVEGVTSISPNMTLVPTTGVMIAECEYNRDINKAFAELQQAIISLGGNI